MAEQMNIYQKLARIRKQVEVIQKNKSGYGYKYVSEDEILAKISVFMDKYGLSLIPNIKQGSTIVSPYTYKKTKTTDIDGLIEYHDSEYILLEVKHKDARVPYGQRLAIQRMVDDFTKAGTSATPTKASLLQAKSLRC